MHIPNHIDTDPTAMTFGGGSTGGNPSNPSNPSLPNYGQTIGANWGGNMAGLQNAWNNQFGNTAGTNPTNPNPYDFNWGSSTISPYLQEGNQMVDPTLFGGNQAKFLASQGIFVDDLTEEELAFLPSMDKLNTAWNRMNTNVGMARTGLGFGMDASQLAGTQNLLGMTGGQGLSSIGGGFGKAYTNMTSNLRSQGQQYRTDLNKQFSGFQSDILGMQYDWEDAQTGYQDALTTSLGNLIASGETDATVSTDPNFGSGQGHAAGSSMTMKDGTVVTFPSGDQGTFVGPKGGTWVFDNSTQTWRQHGG